ncbi:MAG TPA: hypothetical protein PLZ21_05805, partial [Armatimonadota bacterium]|nr:hypothetical protein [Armatimonadota bacterium]
MGAAAPLQSTGGSDPVISADIGTGANQLAAGNDSRFPTTGEKAALAGTSGTPSDTNRYVTDSDARLSDARKPTAHKSTHAIGGSDALTPEDIGAETPAGAQAKANAAESNTKAYADEHINNTSNPHGVTKSQVGLGNVANYDIATQAEAEAGTSNSKYMTPQRTRQAIDALQAVKSVAGKTGTVTLTKEDVGLGNVDNKSSATIRSEITFSNVTNALGYTPENTANKGAPNGYANLDSNGLIPVSQIPSTFREIRVVDDIDARDALIPYEGLRVHVKNASADSTVGEGWAEYLFDGTSWVKTAEAESIDVVQQWANIQGKPTSSVASIDDAVSKRHSHSNKAILDAITSAGSGSIITAAERTKLANIEEWANRYIHPKDGGGTRTNLSGPTVISGITVNAEGHVTGTTVRNLTASDIGAARKYSTNVGGSASQVITHNLGTRDVVVLVRENNPPYAQVYCDIEMTTENTITLRFAVAP